MDDSTQKKTAKKIKCSVTHKQTPDSTKTSGSYSIAQIQVTQIAHNTPTSIVGCYVELPPLVLRVMLSPSHAALLSLLEASDHSINTLELEKAGATRISQSVDELRQMGALIETTKKDVLYDDDYDLYGVLHYAYKGWDVEITLENLQNQESI